MEKSNIIFRNDNDNLEIFWQVGNTPANGEAKGVKVNCKAINPNDGKTYKKYAGWLGLSLTLHGGVKTPKYINDAACGLIQKHKGEILPAIIQFLKANGNNYRAKEFQKAKAKSAGEGVAFRTSHPKGEGQREKVRAKMRKNATRN